MRITLACNRLLLLLGLATHPAIQVASGAELSKQEIVDGLTGFHDRFMSFSSLRVRFRTGRGQVLSAARYTERIPFFCEGAIKNGMVYMARQDLTPPKRGEKLESVRYSICRNGLFFRHQGRGALITDSPIGDTLEFWWYTDNLFVNVYSRMDTVAIMQAVNAGIETEKERRAFEKTLLQYTGQPFLPDEILTHNAEYFLRPATEVVDGAECHVLERTGVDKLWIDTQHGFIVRRRVLHWGPGQPISRDIIQHELFEAKPGLWLPREQEIVYYPNPAHEAAHLLGKPGFREFLVLEDIEFDTVPDTLFARQIPAGVNVADVYRGLEYRTQSADEDPFGQALRFAASRNSPIGRLMALAGLTCVLACLAFYAVRRFRARAGDEGEK